MDQQVGGFGDQMVAIVLDRGDSRFQGLLVEFLGAMLGTLVQQVARIGRFSARRRAGIDGGGQVINRKTRHQLNSRAGRGRDAVPSRGFSTSGTGSRQGSSRIGSPARTMWSLASRMVNSPKWKIDAASTAVACPSLMPSSR